MAITEVGAGSQRATGFCAADSGCDSTAVAFPANVTSGNALIVSGWCWRFGSAPADCGVSDSQGNSYTIAVTGTASDSGIGGEFRYFVACAMAGSTGANTVTVNPTGGSTDWIGYSIDEFSGVSSCTPNGTTGITTGTDTVPTTVITTTVADTVIMGAMSARQQTPGSLTITPGSGWTEVGEAQTCCGGGVNTNFQFGNEFRIAGAASTYTTDWTLGASKAWGVIVAAFAPTVTAATSAAAAGIFRLKRTRWG